MAAALCARVPLAGAAPAPPPPPPPVLHEPLPEDLPDTLAPPTFVFRAGRGSQFPAALRREGVTLEAPAPAPAPPAAPDDPVYRALPAPAAPAGADPGALSRGVFVPDERTGREGLLRYHVVFEPSVVPFKRAYAFDRVMPDGRLLVGEPTSTPVPVLGPLQRAGRELFWATLVVDFEVNRPVTIPSLAPDMGILAVESTSRAPLQFVRDGADNFAVQSAEAGAVRLNLLVDAPSTYFARELPATVNPDDIPASLRPILPPEFQRRAERLWPLVGLPARRGVALAAALRTLVGYFRAFEPGEFRSDSGNTYEDLVRSRRGVCRHRSYAFVITAQSLGLPARLVGNEAHVFVEVWLPDAGWLRIDLGGGALGLEALGRGAGERVRHVPAAPDPFPRPPAFTSTYSAESLAPSRASGPGAGRTNVQGLGPTLAERRAAARAAARVATSVPSLPPDTAASPPPPDRGADPVPAPAVTGGRAAVLELRLAEAVAFRGDPVHLSGRLADVAGSGLPGRPVRLLLLAQRGQRADVLGLVLTDANGRFAVSVRIPATAPPGDYVVRADFAGDERYAPARSAPSAPLRAP